MTSLILQGGPQAGRDSKIGNQVGDFDPLNDSMNSNQDGVLAQAFARSGDDLGRQTFEDVPREPSVSGRPADKSMAHGAEQTADPADANDSDGQDASNTAVEKYSDSLHNLQDLSNAAEFADQEKDHHGATSTHVQQQPSSPAPQPKTRSVLVAKCLTNSDASSGRIILPRVAVEANLPFVTAYRHYALAVRDSSGRRYEFVIKSWANGTEHRRVFVLEQASEFLRAHNVGVGDTVGICTDEYGELVVEANTADVKHATVSPRYGALAMAAPPRGASAAATSAVPLAAVMAGRCARSVHCTKAAGHPGFCSGPKAAAVAAAAAAQAHAAGAAAVARFRRKTHTTAPAYNNQAHMVVPTAAGESSDALATVHHHHHGEDAAAYSSDEAHTAPSSSPNHRLVIATQKGEHSLPEGLHTIAYVPAGLRISKTLTAYDITSKRIILPAEELEGGIPNCCDEDVFTLAAVDESQTWQFPTLRAWHTVAGRRGYLLEAADQFLSSRQVVAGDTLVVYRDADMTPPRIEVRAGTSTVDARRPSVANAVSAGTGSTVEKKVLTFSQLPMLLHPENRRGHLAYHHNTNANICGGTATTPRSSAGNTSSGAFRRSTETTTISAGGLAAGTTACNRTNGCIKAAGHQGFCSGHKGFKRREGTPTGAAGSGFRGGHPLRQHRVVPRSSNQYQQYTDDDEDMLWNSEDDDYSPAFKRAKRGSNVSTPRAGDPLLSLLQLLDA